MNEIYIRCGTLVKLKVPLLNNPEGSVGVVYDTFHPFHKFISGFLDKGNPITCIMLENGQHEDIKPHMIDLVCEVIGFDKFFALYAYKNIADLEQDFHLGYFQFAFELAFKLTGRKPEVQEGVEHA